MPRLSAATGPRGGANHFACPVSGVVASELFTVSWWGWAGE